MMTVDKNHYLPGYQEKFTVRTHDAIVMLLMGLARKNVTLSAEFNAGTGLMLTIVLDVDPEEDIIYLDAGPNEDLNNKLLSSGSVNFLGIYDGAVIQWASRAVASANISGQKVFRVDIPRELEYIQRRDSYRVDTPIANPVICRIPITPEHEVPLRLVDIGIGGISVVLPPRPEPEIHESAEFQNCRIKHPDLGEIAVALVVRSVWTVTLKNGIKREHAGLEFVKLRSETQSIIQRFVYKLERRLIATTRDRITAVPKSSDNMESPFPDPSQDEHPGSKTVGPEASRGRA